MKKSFFAALSFAALLCGCTSPVDSSNEGTARFFVEEKGYVNSIFSFFNFTKENPGCDIYGFCPKEDFGCWSNGDQVLIDLKVAPKSEFTAKFKIDRVITPNEEAFVFDVLANDNYLTQISLNGGGIFYLNVPKEMVAEDGFVRLTFNFKNAALPSKYNPENTDPRKLGLVLNALTIYGYSLENQD